MNSESKLKIYEVMSDIRDSLIDIKPQDLDRVINQALSKIGNLVNQDRAYIFEYDLFNRTASNTFEWCKDGIEPMIDFLQDIPIEDVSDFYEIHKNFETIHYPDVSKLGNETRIKEILESQGIKSMTAIPMIYHGKLEGFIGFDAVENLYQFDEFELKVLKELAGILEAHIMYNKIRADFEENDRKLQLIINQSQIGTWEFNTKDHSVLVNAVFARAIGFEYKPKVLTSKVWEDFIHPADAYTFITNVEDVLTHKKDTVNFVTRIKHTNGDYLTFNIAGAKIIDINSKEEKVYGTLINITNVIKNHEQLLTFERAVLNSATPMFISNDKKEITFINPQVTEMLGFNEEDVLGQKVEMLGTNVPKDLLKEIYRKIDSKEVWSGEIPLFTKNGEMRQINAQISPVFNESDEIINYVGTLIDISDLKEKEVSLTNKNAELADLVSAKMKDYNELLSVSTLSFARLTEGRDYETGQHVVRVQHLCKALAENMATNDQFKDQITPDFIDGLFQASSLHDIGKIVIPDSILLKPGKFTPEEWEIMKSHVKIGADTIKDMLTLSSNNPVMKIAENVIRYHHEKWDGSGYLEGLKGEEIPLCARIMAIADAYDAIRSVRPYKSGKSHEEAVFLITKDSGTHFDPNIIEVFKTMHHQFEDIYNDFKDE